jgi:hypothetical protein
MTVDWEATRKREKKDAYTGQVFAFMGAREAVVSLQPLRMASMIRSGYGPLR